MSILAHADNGVTSCFSYQVRVDGTSILGALEAWWLSSNTTSAAENTKIDCSWKTDGGFLGPQCNPWCNLPIV